MKHNPQLLPQARRNFYYLATYRSQIPGFSGEHWCAIWLTPLGTLNRETLAVLAIRIWLECPMGNRREQPAAIMRLRSGSTGSFDGELLLVPRALLEHVTQQLW